MQFEGARQWVSRRQGMDASYDLEGHSAIVRGRDIDIGFSAYAKVEMDRVR
jgi:hypothetical protein